MGVKKSKFSFGPFGPLTTLGRTRQIGAPHLYKTNITFKCIFQSSADADARQTGGPGRRGATKSSPMTGSVFNARPQARQELQRSSTVCNPCLPPQYCAQNIDGKMDIKSVLERETVHIPTSFPSVETSGTNRKT